MFLGVEEMNEACFVASWIWVWVWVGHGMTKWGGRGEARRGPGGICEVRRKELKREAWTLHRIRETGHGE